MTLTLTQSATAVAANITASFLAVGGTAPYAYAVLGGGAGGSIDSSTGVYTAPSVLSTDPAQSFDSVVVTDATAATASAQITVGTPLILFCDILQSELALANGRVYLWDQKIIQPTDDGLYVAVSVPSCKPFSNTNRYKGFHTLNSEQSVNMLARVDIDVISRGPAARDRKEEVILALNSDYAQRQQEANSFYVGKVSASNGFMNLSQVDGTAIPYRYKISVNMHYSFSKARNTEYFDTFAIPTVATNA